MQAPTSRPRLTRDRDNAMLGGVCAGIAKRYGYDPTVVRVAAVLLSVAWGAGIVLYLALWVLMPAETLAAAASDGTAAGDPMSAEVVVRGALAAAAPASGAAAGMEDLAERARRTAEELAVAARNAAEAARAAADQLVVAARAASAAGRESWAQQRAPRTEGVADASVPGEASEGGAAVADASEVTAGAAGAPDVAGERERA